MTLRKNNAIKSIVLVLITLFLLVFVYPQVTQQVFGFESPLQKPFHLGLDLQGGTHLVYEADMSEIPASQRSEAMDGVRDVIERRINAFGVAEPIVQVTKTGDSWRLIVELAGIKDVNEAIKLIGQTPLLEFKERNDDPPAELTEEQQKELDSFNAQAEQKAEDYLKRVLSNSEEYTKIKEEEGAQQNLKVNPDGTASLDFSNLLQRDVLAGNLGFIGPNGQYSDLYDALKEAPVGQFYNKVVKTSEGYNVIRVIEKKDTGKEIKASHILVCYQGATGCTSDRSKEDALQRINEFKTQVTSDNFATFAQENSDEPAAKDTSGNLGWFGTGRMTPTFEDAAFAVEKGTISDVVETEFGYHLIYKVDERPVTELNIDQIVVKGKTAQDYLPPRELFKNTALSGKHLKRAVVDFDRTTGQPLVNLEFNDEGKSLFAEITQRNIGKPLAIYLDGKSIIDVNGDNKIDDLDIYAPIIQTAITDGRAQITGTLVLDEVKQLVKRLNSGALPVPINLINQQTVGATLGAQSVNESVQAGLWGIILVMLFMLLYYRLPGLTSVLSLILYSLIVLALFKIIPVTLTLSGIAGFILSIGMAVDANVLIFERIKEELRLGKTLYSSINDGFQRAWTSIRDGNVSTLITCVILLTFGTGIIKGFAVTLGVGVLISMFSAIIVTKVYLYAFSPNKLDGKRRKLFLGGKK